MSALVKIGDVIPEGIGVRLSEIAAGLTPKSKVVSQSEYYARITDERKRLGKKLMGEASVPVRHRTPRVLEHGGAWGQTFQRLKNRLLTGFMIALAGGRGNGKTQMAVELVRVLAFAEKPRRSRYCTATEFFMEIKATYRADDGKTEGSVVREFAKPALLVIDEISKRRESEWENLLLHELLNRRYGMMLDTLLISNQEPKQLEESLGSALVSRMVETGGIVECNWPSFRK